MISRLPCCVAQNSIRVKSSWVPRDQRSVLYATTASYRASFSGSVTHGLRFLRSHGATVPDLVSATTPMTVIPSRSQNARDFSSWVSIPMPCCPPRWSLLSLAAISARTGRSPGCTTGCAAGASWVRGCAGASEWVRLLHVARLAKVGASATLPFISLNPTLTHVS